MRWGAWIARAAAMAAAAAAALAIAAWVLARPPQPDKFYASAPATAQAAGVLLRSEPFARGAPPGARAWRILYATTAGDGSARIASALVMIPADAPPGPRPVIAWAHGTSGVAAGCAPSMTGEPYRSVPALAALAGEGWALVAPDYIGLGVEAGGHAFLVGPDAAHAMLDAVRAARQIKEAALSERIVAWGHSQGGGAALWTGVLAPSYAPDLTLAGVAALAPATDLATLFEENQAALFGKIVSSYMTAAYEKAYPDTRALSYVEPGARWLTRDIASRCLGGLETAVSVAQTALLPREGIFWRSPAEGPLGARLAENTPRLAIAAPVLIAQGENDDLVLARIQNDYVAAQCAQGQPIDYRRYPGRDHVSLLAADSPLTGALAQWTRERFAGAPATPSCPRGGR